MSNAYPDTVSDRFPALLRSVSRLVRILEGSATRRRTRTILAGLGHLALLALGVGALLLPGLPGRQASPCGGHQHQ